MNALSTQQTSQVTIITTSYLDPQLNNGLNAINFGNDRLFREFLCARNFDDILKFYVAANPLVAQMGENCCKKNCADPKNCKTLENRKARNDRRKKAADKQKFLELRKEKAMMLRLLEKNKSARSKLQMTAQIFENVWNMPGKVNTTLDTITTGVSGVTDLIATLTEKINSICATIGVPEGLDILDILLALYSGAAALMNNDKVLIVTSVICIARKLKIDYQKWIAKALSLVKTVAGYKDTEMSAQMFDFDHTSILSVLGSFLITLLSMMTTTSTYSYAGCVKHMADFGRAAIGWTKLSDLFNWVKDFFLDLYYRNTAGKTKEQVDMENRFPQLENTLAKCNALRSKLFEMSYLDRHADLCTEIVKLENDLMDLKFAAIRAKENQLQLIINAEISRLSPIFTAARGSAAYAHQKRPAPATLYVYGRAGVGKSNLIEYMKAAIYARHYKNDDKWTMHTVSHTRSADNEFWDGIMPGVPIVVYDDIFQAKDSLANPNPEIMEIIRIKNETPYHLHMSAVADKKNCYFTSKYVLATSNIKTFIPVSISDKNALHRRFDISIEVKVNPQFGKPSDDNSYSMIDSVKVNQAAAAGAPAFNTHVYLIDVYKMCDGSIIKSNLTLEEFTDYFFSHSEKVLEASQTMNESLMQMFDIQAPTQTGNYEEFQTKFKAQAGDEEFQDCEEIDNPPAEEEIIPDRTIHFLHHDLITENARQISENEIVGAPMTQEQYMQMLEQSLVDNETDFRLKWEFLTKKDSRICEGIYDLLTCGPMVTFRRYMKKFTNDMSKLYHSPLLTLGEWLYRFLSSPYPQYVLLGLYAISATYAIDSVLFSQNVCTGIHLTTIKELSVPTCTCSICSKFSSDSLFGSTKYGIDYATYLQEKFGVTEARKKVINSSQSRLLDEMVLQRLSEHSSFGESLQSVGFVSESRTTNTRSSQRHYLAESRTTNTRSGPRQFAAESRETMTRRERAPYHAEVSPPIYSDGPTGLQLVAQSSDLVQLEQWESITIKNMVTLKTGKGQYVEGVFIKGRTLLTVNHFVEAVQEGNGKFTIIPVNNSEGNTVLLSSCHHQQLTDQNGNKIDLCFLAIPNQPSRRDIISKFATANSIGYLNEGSYVISGIRDFNGVNSVYTYHGDKLQITQGTSYASNTGPQRVHASVYYDVDTKPGDCGSLVYAKNSFLAGKVFGMHVAGCKGKGMSCVVSRELLERNLASFSLTVPSRMIVDAKIPFSAEMNKPEYKDAIPSTTLTKLGNCLSLGMLKNPFAATKTQLRPSLVSGTLQEPNTKPAALRPILVEDKMVDPLIKGATKVLNVTEPLDIDLLDVVTQDVANIHHSETANKTVLTFEEAVQGVEDAEYITPLNRTSSPGYPYTLDNPESGKRFWFGYDEYNFSDEIREDVEHLLNCCRNNQRGDVIWTATLKDERREISKVDAGKTRVFTAGPQHFTIAMRMYFLRFVEHIMKNKISNEIGVGTNVYSIDWDHTGRALSKYGKNVFAGDFSGFDGSLLQDVLWKICDMINEWYDDGPENAQTREVLFEEICNARVLIKGEIIQWDHSQPSGNPGTVIFNSLFNQIIMRYAYMLCKEKAGLPMMCDFAKHVSLQTYGDDNVLNVDDDTIEWFNQLTATQALGTIGMTYTDEGKTGELIRSRTLNDVAYLKRRFVRNSNGYFDPPLDIGVCREMTNWIRGTKGTGKDATYENCEASIRELYFHGKEMFDQGHAALTNALRKNGINERLPTYPELKSFYSSNYFG